ncbi:MAG: dihydrodipicolinate reductase C-terminal domain-containing protein [Vicinamibacterales bacterium]
MTGPAPARLRALLVGYGRMGRMVESLADEYGVDVVGRVTRDNSDDAASWPEADVAIDFSAAAAVPANAPRLAARQISIVIGTTGWQESEPEVRRAVQDKPVGVIAAPNFAIGVNLFSALAARAAELLAGRGFEAWIHEAHHSAKRDAPSGTALALQRVLMDAGAGPAIDVSSTRAGRIPGTHTIGFDSAAEAITLTHEARDRTPFARGALEAARWLHGRRGWFTMQDMLEVT